MQIITAIGKTIFFIIINLTTCKLTKKLNYLNIKQLKKLNTTAKISELIYQLCDVYKIVVKLNF